MLFGHLVLSFLLLFSPVTSNWVKAEELNPSDGQAKNTTSVSQQSEVFEYEGVELEVVNMENSTLDSDAVVKSVAAEQYEQAPEAETVSEEGSVTEQDPAQVQESSTNFQQSTVMFTDVPKSYWAFINVQYLAGQNVISGYQKGDGTAYFLPDNKVTRAQAAKMIVEALGQQPVEHPTGKFTDVPSHHWAAGYIERAYELGVFGGYANGSFGVNDTLKRSQMAKVVAEALHLDYNGHTPGAPVFRDVPRSYWAFDYIEKLYYNGISSGSNFRFLPEDEITRAQFSAFLSRAIDDQFKLTVPEREQISGDVISTGTVTTSASLNVRQGPSDKEAILGSLSKGTLVNIYAFDGYWAKISYHGMVGYVHKSYLKLHSLDSRYPLKNRIIVVDAGHGAHDPGTAYKTTYEKDIVLKVAKKVANKLEAAGAKVVMTRQTDNFLSLQERVDYTRSVYGEIFVSIHVNSASSTSAKGSETYYNTSKNVNSAESKLLAYEIQRQLVSQANMYDRKIKDADFYVIKYNQVPAVLVELGFLSNSDDRSKLTSDTYLEKYAEAIYQGIENYYLK